MKKKSYKNMKWELSSFFFQMMVDGVNGVPYPLAEVIVDSGKKATPSSAD